MSDGDAERLVILLEAKVADLEKNMAKASGVTAKAYRQMSLGSKKATTQMEGDMIRSTLRINQALASTSAKIGVFSKSFMAGAVAPIAGLLTLTAAMSGAKKAMSEFADVSHKAAAAGLNTDLFQTLAFEAKRVGVEFEGASGALATFNKNLGDADAGRGKMLTALKAIAPELASQVAAARSTEDAFRAVSSALRDTKNDAQRAAIAAAAFGDSGKQLANAWAMGGDKIDQLVTKAKDLGIVVDAELVRRAEELGDKYDTAAQIVDLKLKQAFINLAPFMVQSVSAAAELARLLGVAADQLNEIGDRQFIRPLQNTLVQIENERATLLAQIKGLQDQLKDLDPASGWAGTVTGEINEKAAQAEELLKKALEYQERIAQLQGKPAMQTPPKTTGSAYTGGWGSGSLQTSPATDFDFRSLLDPLTKTTQATKDATDATKGYNAMLSDLSDLLTSSNDPFAVQQSQLDKLGALLNAGQISWEQYGQAAERANLQAAAGVLDSVGQITGALSDAFRDNKALAAANAAVSTAAGVMKALEQGGMFGWAQAAAIGAAGAVQIGSIMSAQPGSGSVNQVSGAGAATSAAVAQQSQQAINLTVRGSGSINVDDLVRQLTSQIADGGYSRLVNVIRG